MKYNLFIVLVMLVVLSTCTIASETNICVEDGSLTTVICQGLINRVDDDVRVFTKANSSTDPKWQCIVEALYPDIEWQTKSATQLKVYAIQKGYVTGQVLWSGDELEVNNVTMLCSLYNAIPTTTELEGLTVVYDTTNAWEDNIAAAEWAQEHLLSLCNSDFAAVFYPTANHLRDFIVAEKMFVMWGDDDTDENIEVYKDIVETSGHFSENVEIMGYTPGMTGDEVAARETDNHSQISLVSDYACNLSYYHTFDEIDSIEQCGYDTLTYDDDKTYVSIIISDGDNLQLLLNNILYRIEDRTDYSYTINWTLSPRCAEIAPIIIEWYYNLSVTYGADSFLMGPSGYGFIDPSENPNHDWFAGKTIELAKRLDMQGYVHWDQYYNLDAMEESVQAYADSYVQGVFSPVQPYIPQVVDNVVSVKEYVRWSEQTPEDVADTFNDCDPGFGYLYVLPDVGVSDIDTFVSELDDNVVVVDYRTMIDLLKQKNEIQSVIVSQSESQLVTVGQTVELEVDAIGATSYQWYHDGVQISGATTAVLDIEDITTDDEGEYICVVKNANITGFTQTEPIYIWTERLVAYWSFDGTLTDEVGGFEGVYTTSSGSTGTPVYSDDESISGQSIYFDSSDSYFVEVTDSEDFFNFYPLGYTIGAWIKTTTSGGAFVSKEVNSDWTNGWALTVYPGYPVHVLRPVGDLYGTGSAVDGDWHYVVGTYEPAGYDPDNPSNHRLTVYMDGLLQNEKISTGDIPLSTAAVIMGCQTPQYDAPYDGYLDEFSIWSYPLDNQEIAQIYADGSGQSVCIGSLEYDLNDDCTIDMTDLLYFIELWMETGQVYSFDE